VGKLCFALVIWQKIRKLAFGLLLVPALWNASLRSA
jgi:hypothetical protein